MGWNEFRGKVNLAAASKIFEPSLPVLIKILDSADDTHHAAALNILSYINSPEARSALNTYSKKEFERVKAKEEQACGANKIYNFKILEEAPDKLVFSVEYFFDSILPGKRNDTNMYSDLSTGGMDFKGMPDALCYR